MLLILFIETILMEKCLRLLTFFLCTKRLPNVRSTCSLLPPSLPPSLPPFLSFLPASPPSMYPKALGRDASCMTFIYR